MAIREHKLEMQRKVESLQQSLEATERRLRDAQRDLLDKNNQVRTSDRHDDIQYVPYVSDPEQRAQTVLGQVCTAEEGISPPPVCDCAGNE